MALNKISSSKKEIYTKVLDIAEKYTDIENVDFLKTGLFGYITESIAMMIRDSSYHKSMVYNENFLNTAILPQSVYNWAKMFNIQIQKATPKYADIEIRIPVASIDSFLKDTSSASYNQYKEYGIAPPSGRYLIINKNNPIIIGSGDYYFSLEHSILLVKATSDKNSTNRLYTARYITEEKQSTNFQTPIKSTLPVVIDRENIIIKARVYQYRKTTFKKQISTTSFLNKSMSFNFEDQFCGARLFYEENGSEEEINLKYSDDGSESNSKSAFYNLSSENEIEIRFKIGKKYFKPTSNSILHLDVYTTKGLSAPSAFSGSAVMLFSEVELKSLPMVINFNPINLMGGKNLPSLSEIKKTIINEISTRNTITTKTDLDNYFSILTSLISDINEGKIKFIKKRDDIIKRNYNAYLLLREDISESSETDIDYTSSRKIPPCIPTNTLDVLLKRKNELRADYINYNYPIFDTDGKELDENNNEDDFYLCPFNIFVTTHPVNFVKFIYNLTNDETGLDFSSDFKSNNSEYMNSNNSTLDYNYIVPESVSITRDFGSENVYRAEKQYKISLVTTTNHPIGSLNDVVSSDQNPYSYSGSIKIIGQLSELELNAEDGEIVVKSSLNEENSYTTTIDLYVTVSDNEFYFLSQESSLSEKMLYCNSINLQNKNTAVDTPFNEKEKFKFDLSDFLIDNKKVGVSLEAANYLQLYKQLDNIMESSLVLRNNESNANDYPAGIREVPLIHSSFFKNSTNIVTRRENFIKQLFTYIKILNDNIEKLETSTFFNLKFYNTYGLSNLYYTSSTNLKLDMQITLLSSEYNTDIIKSQIKSYIRKFIDSMNDSEAINISALIAALTNKTGFGNYIKYVTFVGLNGTFNQYIKRLDIDESEYTPEWLNIDHSSLNSLSNDYLGITFNV